jgi:hypothetical protein
LARLTAPRKAPERELFFCLCPFFSFTARKKSF